MNQETILIAEDNEVLRDALKEMLALTGYRVMTAGNGEEALAQMAKVTPDLILSDISMPGMDGYEFFRRVRSRTEWLAIPFLFLTAWGTKDDILSGKGLGAEDYLVKPVHRDELITAVRSRLHRSNQLRLVQLREAYESSLTVLANAIEARDHYTRGHVERVREYALMIGRKLGLGKRPLDELRRASILHDIGKIHIREAILRKTDPLTAEEWEEIKRHPIIGAEMIRGVPYLASAIPVIRHHHEYWDGSGYPDGLAGEDIPVAARIVTVADSFDAMTSDRTYQPKKKGEEALVEILRGAGSRYDPKIVVLFKKAWDEGMVQAIVSKDFS